jgi:hypothetical protein
MGESLARQQQDSSISVGSQNPLFLFLRFFFLLLLQIKVIWRRELESEPSLRVLLLLLLMLMLMLSTYARAAGSQCWWVSKSVCCQCTSATRDRWEERERDSGGHVDDREEERVRLSIASYRITAQCSASQRIASVVGGLGGKITHRIVEGSWPQTECTGPNFGVRPLDYLDN